MYVGNRYAKTTPADAEIVAKSRALTVTVSAGSTIPHTGTCAVDQMMEVLRRRKRTTRGSDGHVTMVCSMP